MKIQIGGLSEGIHAYQFDEKASELGLDEEFSGDIHVDVTLDKSGSQIALKGSVRTTGRFSCDRCAAPLGKDLAATYRMFYVWDGMDADDSLDPSEVQVIPHGLSIIDIADDVRQTVILSVPLKLLCKENCRGLCPSCGIDLNTGSCSCSETESDSRWDALRALSSGAAHRKKS
jgi:uncharacterized protein